MGKNDDTMDAAQAFEELQMEVALQRQAIEALRDAVAGHPVSDLGNEMAMLLKGQMQLQKQFKRQEEVLQQHPGVQQTPAQFEQAFVQAGSKVVREAAQQLAEATQKVEYERVQLSSLIGTVDTQEQQNRWLWWTAGAALAIGMMLSPLLVLLLPVSLSSYAAAFLVGNDRWDAGWALMQAASSEKASQISDAVHLVQINEKVLSSCKEAAVKTKRDQRCTFTVSPL